LLCGFGPFPSAPDNPAARTVERLKTVGWAPARAEVGYTVLPTIWTEAPARALAAADQLAADAVLLIGVAVGASAFRVETTARNRAGESPDAAGARWPSPFVEDSGPNTLAVTAPVTAIVEAIAAEGLPAEVSEDAGDYLCNFTLYRLLRQAEGRPIGFLHTPPPGDALTLDDIEAAARAAAQAFVANLR
jgi:pyroglutamyl-peptidase